MHGQQRNIKKILTPCSRVLEGNMFIYAAKKFVIDDAAEFTAFHVLVLGGVYMDSAIFIVRFQHVSPVFSLFLLILPL
jgi:hypothetical protein